MKSVRFINFWKTSSSVQKYFFRPLFERVFREEVRIASDPSSFVDLEIHSVFPPQRSIFKKTSDHFGLTRSPKIDYFSIQPNTKSKYKIWFSGENIRPPYHLDFDAFLSFEDEEFDCRNLYLPLWVLNLNWFGYEKVHGFAGISPTQTRLLEPRKADSLQIMNRKFCAAFVGNPENLRLSAINYLGQIEKVDVFGRMVDNVIDDKISVENQYKFVLAFENQNTPGYVTEKLLEAHLTGALPIYWGSDSQEYFNRDAYLDFANFESWEDFSNSIRKLQSDSDKLFNILTKPILRKPFLLDEVIAKLRKIMCF